MTDYQFFAVAAFSADRNEGKVVQQDRLYQIKAIVDRALDGILRATANAEVRKLGYRPRW